MKFTVTVFYADKQVEKNNALGSDAVNRILYAYGVTSSHEKIEAIKVQNTFKFEKPIEGKIIVKREVVNES